MIANMNQNVHSFDQCRRQSEDVLIPNIPSSPICMKLANGGLFYNSRVNNIATNPRTCRMPESALVTQLVKFYFSVKEM